jgi:hypothetical protein
LLLLALLTLLCVPFDLLDNGLYLLVGLGLPFLNLVAFGLDASNLAVFLGLLVFVLCLEQGDPLFQVDLDSFIDFCFSLQNATLSIDLLLQLGLLFLVQTVLTGLCALDLALQILDVQVFLDLSLVLLPLQLLHLLRVLVLLTSEFILHILVLSRRLVNVSGQLLLLLLESLVATRLLNLFFDDFLEVHKGQIRLHFICHGRDCLDESSLVIAHLVLILLNSWFLFKLTAQVHGTFLESIGNILRKQMAAVSII